MSGFFCLRNDKSLIFVNDFITKVKDKMSRELKQINGNKTDKVYADKYNININYFVYVFWVRSHVSWI